MGAVDRRWRPILPLLAVLFLAPVYFADETYALDAQQVTEDNEVAVLLIVGDKSGEVVQGSGACIDAELGLVLATAHQTTGVAEFRALTADGEEFRLELLETDVAKDLAVFKADRPLPKSVVTGDTEGLRNGAPVVSISSPQGIAFSTYTGAITNARFHRDGHPVLLTDLPLAPGASGGPVFDAQGRLIGVVSGSVTEVRNTVVVPIESALDLLCVHTNRPEGCRDLAREEPILTARQGASAREQQAVEAYNQGVEADDPAQKIPHYRSAVNLVPAFYEAWFNLGVAASATGDAASAIEAYSRARSERPESARVRRNLGQVLLKAGRIQEGALELEAAVRLAPDDERAHNDLGEAFRRLNRLDEAVTTFQKALALRTAYPAARYNLGLTYAQLGRADAAIEQFRAYLELAPDAGDADQVRQWIRELEANEG